MFKMQPRQVQYRGWYHNIFAGTHGGDVGKIIPGDGASPTTPLSIMDSFLYLRQYSAKIGVLYDNHAVVLLPRSRD